MLCVERFGLRHIAISNAIRRVALFHQNIEGEHYIRCRHRLAVVMKARFSTEGKLRPALVGRDLDALRQQAVNGERLILQFSTSN